MAKPGDLYPWATDVGATVDPGPTRKATGFVAGKKPPAKWVNWLENGAYKWRQYLDNLHGETEFLNKIYAWTGLHSFADNVDFNDPVTLDDTVTLDGASNEVVYGAARTRTVLIAMAAAQFHDAGGDLLLEPGNGTASIAATIIAGGGLAGTAHAVFPIRIPVGSTLTRVRSIVNPTTSMTLRVCQQTPDWGTPATSGASLAGLNTAGTAIQVLDTDSVSMTPVLIEAIRTYTVEVQFNDVGDALQALELTYTETAATGQVRP